MQVLNPIVEACSQLQVLKLHSCISLQPRALQPILKGLVGGKPPGKLPALPHLTDLDVSYCNLLPQEELSELLLCAHNLKVLPASGLHSACHLTLVVLRDHDSCGMHYSTLFLKGRADAACLKGS